MNEPLVSVVMPVYNGQRFVGEAAKSVLDQTYKNLELIIINDGSTDNTGRILKSLKKLHPDKIRVVSLWGNQGESKAANTGFRLARGEFIARMDADDICYPERISKQVNYLMNHPDVVVVGTQADIIDEKGRVTGQKLFPTSHQQIYRDYGIYHPMLHPSCVFRKNLLPRRKKLWEATHEPHDDYYTLFKLLRFGKFANLPEKLMAYRIHGKNKSLQGARSKFFFTLKIRVEAVKHMGYKMDPLSVLINIAEIITVVALPEALIVPTYCFVRSLKQYSRKSPLNIEFGKSNLNNAPSFTFTR